MNKRIEGIKVAIYTAAMILIFANIVTGILKDINLIFDFRGLISILSLVHFIILILFIWLWSKKICPYYETAKAPIYIVFLAWYSSITIFLFVDDNDGPTLYGSEFGVYNTYSPMFFLLIIASLLFVWYWEKIKDQIDSSFCS